MKRRDFITLVGGATAVWPLAASAQAPDRMQRVGVQQGSEATDSEGQHRIGLLRQELQKLGWTDGHNLRFEYRWSGVDPNRIRSDAVELVGLKPDVILASSDFVVTILKRETSTIPIVFTNITDPVGLGYVASVSHPGGNLTGFASFDYSLSGKMVEVLKETAPNISRVAVILNPEQPPLIEMAREIEAVAPSLGINVTTARVRNAAEIENAIETFAREPNGGLVVLPNPVVNINRQLIILLAARYRLPSIFRFRYYAVDGGLVSYGIDPDDYIRGAAIYVDRILRGEKPSELPVQQPSKFLLVVNLKAAKAIGLDVPTRLLLRADEIIE
jgi:putative tryptophan/tyrosine transport system substrate-binding protein